jgi:exopolysaccharide biosynthesis polyprenyl glycosylphosphotransferase
MAMRLAEPPLDGYGVALLVPFFVLLAGTAGLYRREARVMGRSTLDQLPALLGISGVATLLLGLGIGLATGDPLSPEDLALLWLGCAAISAAGRTVVRSVALRLSGPERCLVLGRMALAESLHRSLSLARNAPAKVVMRLPISDEQTALDLADLAERHGVERVILAPDRGDSDDVVVEVLRRLDIAGLRVSLALRPLEVTGAPTDFDELDGVQMLGLRLYGLSGVQAASKRAFDVALSGVLIVLLSPLLLAIALAVKVGSRGTVLFRQQRAGLGGQPFHMLKFRTMVHGAEQRMEELVEHNQAAPLFKLAEDPRVTRVGRFLRRHSLDELPQLLNVLKGDMSLVGPRPFVLSQYSLFRDWQRGRFELRPGVTGPWQALGTTRVRFDEMVNLDYVYCADWSVWRDIKIVLRTMRYMVPGDRGRFAATRLDAGELGAADAKALSTHRR